jgi:hypothetical protein
MPCSTCSVAPCRFDEIRWVSESMLFSCHFTAELLLPASHPDVNLEPS